jgi:hypothetical protein
MIRRGRWRFQNCSTPIATSIAKNPRGKVDFEHLLTTSSKMKCGSPNRCERFRRHWDVSMNGVWPECPLAKLLSPIERAETVDPSKTYRLPGARWYAQGLFVKDEKSCQEIRASTLYRVKTGDFVYNHLFIYLLGKGPRHSR